MVVHSPADEGVEVNIEANLLSLNSSTLDQRDRNDVTEECWKTGLVLWFKIGYKVGPTKKIQGSGTRKGQKYLLW